MIEDQSPVEQIRKIAWKQSSAVDNMALDVAMLETGPLHGCAFWRVYGWNEPALTFGYSQRWADVEHASREFTGRRIRRMTGGGIVDHRADLTYALSLPPTHPFFRVRALDIYRELHEIVMKVFLAWGVPCVLTPCSDCGREEPGRVQVACFTAPEPYDIQDPRTGHKLAGAAMKRNRSGLLIQGSIDARRIPGLVPERFEHAVSGSLSAWLGWDMVPAGALHEEQLAPHRRQFASNDWNRRR